MLFYTYPRVEADGNWTNGKWQKCFGEAGSQVVAGKWSVLWKRWLSEVLDDVKNSIHAVQVDMNMFEWI